MQIQNIVRAIARQQRPSYILTREDELMVAAHDILYVLTQLELGGSYGNHGWIYGSISVLQTVKVL